MGVSEKRGRQYSTPNSRILMIRDSQNKVSLIFGNSHIAASGEVRISDGSLLEGDFQISDRPEASIHAQQLDIQFRV